MEDPQGRDPLEVPNALRGTPHRKGDWLLGSHYDIRWPLVFRGDRPHATEAYSGGVRYSIVAFSQVTGCSNEPGLELACKQLREAEFPLDAPIPGPGGDNLWPEMPGASRSLVPLTFSASLTAMVGEPCGSLADAEGVGEGLHCTPCTARASPEVLTSRYVGPSTCCLLQLAEDERKISYV